MMKQSVLLRHGWALSDFISDFPFYHDLSVIDLEKVDSRAEVKAFDKSELKHVETDEKTVLPTAGGKN